MFQVLYSDPLPVATRPRQIALSCSRLLNYALTMSHSPTLTRTSSQTNLKDQSTNYIVPTEVPFTDDAKLFITVGCKIDRRSQVPISRLLGMWDLEYFEDLQDFQPVAALISALDIVLPS